SEPRAFRRIAVFGGVYSNAHALAATLADVRRREVDALFCLGDLGGCGPHPDRVFPLLRDAGVRAIQGNYDLAVAEGHTDCGCGYTDPRDNHFAHLSYAYTLARTATENRRWMAALPGHRRLRLGGLPALLCHGSPRAISEFLWESTTPDGLVARFLDDARALAGAVLMTPWLSIVIPARNDAAALARTLAYLARLPGIAGAEVIVAAAGDVEGTTAAVAGRARLLWPHGSTRAQLMNAGAAAARRDTLLFLHADSFLPPEALSLIHGVLADPRAA